MANKTHDLAVKVGEYTDKQGNTKGRYQNVGALMMGDKGPFIMLAKWFNPAGVTDGRGGESILISAFEPKEQGVVPGLQTKQAQKPQASGFDMDQDCPF